MRKIRFATSVLVLFIKRFGITLLFGALLGVALFLFHDKISPFIPGVTRVERIGIVGLFTQESIPTNILFQVSFGLTILDNENIPQPGIAEGWEAQSEGKVWIFKIRSGLRWQDNSPVRSTDFSYKFPAVSVTYPDVSHIKFELQDPYAPFPIVVSRPFFKKGLLGVGELRVKNIISSRGIFKELTLQDRKTNNLEVYKFYPTEQAVVSAFKLGEINKIFEITDPKKLRDWKQMNVETVVHKDRFVGVFLNTQDSLLSQKPVRQALAYAIRKDYEFRAITSISPNSWAYNPLVKTYDYNKQRAKELLNKIPPETRKNLTLRLVTIPSLLSTAEQIAKDWQAVGIETEVQVGSGVPENFQALLATQIIPPDPDQYSMWHSTQTQTNITGFKDPRIDKLLEDGRRTLNPEERRRIYLDSQRFLVEDSPVIFLYHPLSYKVSRK